MGSCARVHEQAMWSQQPPQQPSLIVHSSCMEAHVLTEMEQKHVRAQRPYWQEQLLSNAAKEENIIQFEQHATHPGSPSLQTSGISNLGG